MELSGTYAVGYREWRLEKTGNVISVFYPVEKEYLDGLRNEDGKVPEKFFKLHLDYNSSKE